MRASYHLTQAIRSLRRSPAYVAAFVITLGLAIGANSAVFGLVNGVLLQPLPFQDAERILEPGLHYTGSRQQDFYADYATNDHRRGAAMRRADPSGRVARRIRLASRVRTW